MANHRNLRVVITGASSGIGKATALAFARGGARLALAARRAELLEKLAEQCQREGGEAIAVPTDVRDAEAVARLAATADEAFGGVDVWINNAGTGVFGPYGAADIELHRRTVEVNLFGAMNGAAAVLPIFLRQHRGVLINNISLGAFAPTPFAAAYTASKFGLRGFSASLRQELAAERDIHVCSVFPAIIDTPGFAHAANLSGRSLDPGPLLYAPEDVADTFLRLVRHPRAETMVGWPSRAAQLAYALAPTWTEHAIGTAIRGMLSRADAAPRTEGTLLKTNRKGKAVSGGWRERKGLPHSAATVSRTVGLAALAGAVAIGLGIAAGRARRGRSW
jgi:short-subunit dehydrogenase